METKTSIFISYSWDSLDHRDWVLNLANKLTENGLFVLLDQYDLKVGKPMTYFMERSVNDSKKVLMILTPNYKKKADDREGGVGYEYSIISQQIYEDQTSDKFIPILRTGDIKESAPVYISTLIYHDMKLDLLFDIKLNELLRLIYDEPEIKRPPIGKKPAFISSAKKSSIISLIDDKTNLIKCGMSTFAKWTINIEPHSLSEFSKAKIFTLITEANDPNGENVQLPSILKPKNKVSHHPTISFEVPLQQYFAGNHWVNEKLQIDDGLIHYEFSEYSNNDFWLLYLTSPYSALFFILLILQHIHKKLNRDLDIEISITFESDRKAMFYRNHSPFKVDFLIENFFIPNNFASLTKNLNQITKESLFNLFEAIYGIFVSENNKSIRPYISIDKKEFEQEISKYMPK